MFHAQKVVTNDLQELQVTLGAPFVVSALCVSLVRLSTWLQVCCVVLSKKNLKKCMCTRQPRSRAGHQFVWHLQAWLKLRGQPGCHQAMLANWRKCLWPWPVIRPNLPKLSGTVTLKYCRRAFMCIAPNVHRVCHIPTCSGAPKQQSWQCASGFARVRCTAAR